MSSTRNCVSFSPSDIEGVWTEPVTAEEMITFRALIRTFLRLRIICSIAPGVRQALCRWGASQAH